MGIFQNLFNSIIIIIILKCKGKFITIVMYKGNEKLTNNLNVSGDRTSRDTTDNITAI